MTTRNAALTVVPIEGAAFGARVEGADSLAALSGEDLAVIEEALTRHRMLVFPELYPSDADQSGFAAHFGELYEYRSGGSVAGAGAVSDRPTVLSISNDPDQTPSDGPDEIVWHTNLSYLPRVSSISCLSSPVVAPPECGGDSVWLDTARAYAELPAETRERLADLKLLHVRRLADGTTFRVLHDAVRTVGPLHALYEFGTVVAPDNGRPVVQKSFPALSPEESDELYAQVYRHQVNERYAYHHEWIAGDMLLWDNRTTLHMRAAFVDNGPLRVLKLCDALEDRASGQTDES